MFGQNQEMNEPLPSFNSEFLYSQPDVEDNSLLFLNDKLDQQWEEYISQTKSSSYLVGNSSKVVAPNHTNKAHLNPLPALTLFYTNPPETTYHNNFYPSQNLPTGISSNNTSSTSSNANSNFGLDYNNKIPPIQQPSNMNFVHNNGFTNGGVGVVPNPSMNHFSQFFNSKPDFFSSMNMGMGMGMGMNMNMGMGMGMSLPPMAMPMSIPPMNYMHNSGQNLGFMNQTAQHTQLNSEQIADNSDLEFTDKFDDKFRLELDETHDIPSLLAADGLSQQLDGNDDLNRTSEEEEEEDLFNLTSTDTNTDSFVNNEVISNSELSNCDSSANKQQQQQPVTKQTTGTKKQKNTETLTSFPLEHVEVNTVEDPNKKANKKPEVKTWADISKSNGKPTTGSNTTPAKSDKKAQKAQTQQKPEVAPTSNGSSNGVVTNQVKQVVAKIQKPLGLQPSVAKVTTATPQKLPGATTTAEVSYNPRNFECNVKFAKFFVIKSYSEDDVHKSIKYGVWASTENGNRRLDNAYREYSHTGPIYLFFSVNTSGQFCGMARMTSAVDFNKKLSYWTDDKWTGQFTVKWTFIKDIPNNQFRHIILENNESKPVTKSRDTQEVPLEKGKEMLKIFSSYRCKTSLLDDFDYYDKRQQEMEMARKQPPIATSSSGADFSLHPLPTNYVNGNGDMNSSNGNYNWADGNGRKKTPSENSMGGGSSSSSNGASSNTTANNTNNTIKTVNASVSNNNSTTTNVSKRPGGKVIKQ